MHAKLMIQMDEGATCGTAARLPPPAELHTVSLVLTRGRADGTLWC